jgi:hypothetical protein
MASVDTDDSGDPGIPTPTTTSHEDPMDDDSHEGEKNPYKSALRVEFAIKKSNDNNKKSFNADFNMRSLVEAILKTTTDIIFKTKTGDDSFKNLDDFPKGDAFKLFFPMISIDSTPQGPEKVVAEMFVESPTAIDFYKTKEGTLYTYLDKNWIWITEHRYDTLAIAKIGWIGQISTTLALKQDYEITLQERILKHEKNMREMGSTEPIEPTPRFEIWPRTLRGSKVDGTGKARETRAYEVSCEAIHAATLRAKLMDSQSDEHFEAREGLFIVHGLMKSERTLHDANIDSQNEYLNGLKKIEISGITREAMDIPFDSLGGLSVRDYLLYDGSEDPNGSTFLTIEPTRETDENGKWFLLHKATKGTEATTCVDKLISILRAHHSRASDRREA